MARWVGVVKKRTKSDRVSSGVGGISKLGIVCLVSSTADKTLDRRVFSTFCTSSITSRKIFLLVSLKTLSVAASAEDTAKSTGEHSPKPTSRIVQVKYAKSSSCNDHDHILLVTPELVIPLAV